MQGTPYTLPVAVAGLAVIAAGAFILQRRRHTPAATEFLVLIAAMAWNAVAYLAELTTTSLDAKVALLSLRWVALCAIPAVQLMFALRWGGHHAWQTPLRRALLFGIPVVYLVVACTNEWHQWAATSSVLVQHDGYVMRHAEGRWALWVFVLYAYACLMLSTAVYLRAIYASPLHRSQGVILLIATFVPWVANAIFLAGHSPDPDLDVSVFGYAGAAMAWAFGLSRARFLDVAPIARAQVFEGLTEAVIVVGPRGRVIDWNPAAAALFGRSVEDGIGRSVSELVGADAASRIRDDHAFDLPLLGRTFAVDASPLRGGAGALATIVTLRDVSEQRLVAEAREEALRLAESVARSRAEFLARMSHEVRSPLHAIRGAAELLEGADLPETERRYVRAVQSSSRALLDVVDDLLDLSKLDADRMRVDPIDLDAIEAMREVAALFVGTADRKGVALRVEGDRTLPVRADRARLRQVLVNLVGNALKFTDRGTITLRARRIGELTRIEVADTGVGIPEHARARIFEPFVQVETSQAATSGGTGLGLAIARRLLTLMGGEIDVESEVGEGSVFWLSLPSAAGVAASEPEPVMVSRGAAGARRGRVLVVDDLEVNRFITCALLEREGCEVDAAEGAERALELLAARPYALVLTDLRMPGIDGFELAARIRARENGGAETPVVALTADAYASAELRARGAGMAGWLTKPVDPQRLREVLDRTMQSTSETVAAPSPAPMSVRELLATRPDLHARVLGAFRARTPQDLARIEEAARQERWSSVHETAHALHGAASIVGADELARLCRELARESPAELAGATVAALAPAYASFLDQAVRESQVSA